jgi:hypothetical protein
MATGDVLGNIERLRQELRHIKYPLEVDLGGCASWREAQAHRRLHPSVAVTSALGRHWMFGRWLHAKAAADGTASNSSLRLYQRNVSGRWMFGAQAAHGRSRGHPASPALRPAALQPARGAGRGGQRL